MKLQAPASVIGTCPVLYEATVVNSPFAMKTLLTAEPNEAANIIKSGGIVAFPTETVYGLGANIFDEDAVSKIFEAKMRPADNPLIAHIADVRAIGEIATEVTDAAARFIAAFFPGPLTLVLPKADRVPPAATAGLDSIGVRMPRFPLAQRFLKACGTPVVAPSANISGRPSPTTWLAVFEDLDGRIDCILQGESTEIGLESTVVDCTGGAPLLLRKGAISLIELQAVVPETSFFQSGGGEAIRSPGLLHKHYSPRARVIILDKGIAGLNAADPSSAAYIGLTRLKGVPALELVCPSTIEYARTLFEFFRECDRRGIAEIYCQSVDETGIGAALMDRLRRAADRSFN